MYFLSGVRDVSCYVGSPVYSVFSFRGSVGLLPIVYFGGLSSVYTFLLRRISCLFWVALLLLLLVFAMHVFNLSVIILFCGINYVIDSYNKKR